LRAHSKVPNLHHQANPSYSITISDYYRSRLLTYSVWSKHQFTLTYHIRGSKAWEVLRPGIDETRIEKKLTSLKIKTTDYQTWNNLRTPYTITSKDLIKITFFQRTVFAAEKTLHVLDSCWLLPSWLIMITMQLYFFKI
jgi:hypothetical protein